MGVLGEQAVLAALVLAKGSSPLTSIQRRKVPNLVRVPYVIFIFILVSLLFFIQGKENVLRLSL